MTTYYRLHDNPNAPCFCAEHAYSGQWGLEYTADGSQHECLNCAGDLGDREHCRQCDGTGWVDARYGYSACETAADLVTYMREHGVVSDNAKVVVFDGAYVGSGEDGEDLAVPDGGIRWITWPELLDLAEAGK